MLLLLVACATTARGREAQAVATYTAAVETLTQLRAAGRIDDETWARVQLAVLVAREARRSLVSAREAGESPATVARLLDTAVAAMRAVVQYQEEHP